MVEDDELGQRLTDLESSCLTTVATSAEEVSYVFRNSAQLTVTYPLSFTLRADLDTFATPVYHNPIVL